MSRESGIYFSRRLGQEGEDGGDVVRSGFFLFFFEILSYFFRDKSEELNYLI